MAPQVSLYIDPILYMKIKSRSKESGQSLSGFVSNVLNKYMEDSWPEDYFEKFAGAIDDDSFEAPEDMPLSSCPLRALY